MAQEVKEAEVVAILGTGDVGIEVARGFLHLNYKVVMGTRNLDDKEKTDKTFEAVVKDHNGWKNKFSIKKFAEASKEAKIVVLSVKYDAIDQVLKEIEKHVENKILIDLINPLVADKNGTSLDNKIQEGSCGAHVQAKLPKTHVVKALNNIGKKWMCDANPNNNTFPVSPTMFIAGNSKDAKEVVKGILQKWKWDVFDAGDIQRSHYLECLAMLWIEHFVSLQYNPNFAFAVVNAKN